MSTKEANDILYKKEKQLGEALNELTMQEEENKYLREKLITAQLEIKKLNSIAVNNLLAQAALETQLANARIKIENMNTNFRAILEDRQSGKETPW